jgi:hypothetical protein
VPGPQRRQVRTRAALDGTPAQPADEPLERRARVGHDAERDGPRHADVARIDVHVDHARRAGRPPVLFERHVEVAEPRADREQHVRTPAQFVRRRTLREVAELVVQRHDAATCQRGDHGTAEQFGQFQQCRVGAGAVDPRPGEDDGPVRRCEQGRGRGQMLL